MTNISPIVSGSPELFIDTDPAKTALNVDLHAQTDENTSLSASVGPITMTLERAKRRLGRLLQGALRDIEVTQRGVSPRIVSAELVGSAGTTIVSGPELEAALGLPSAWACFDVTGPSGAPPRCWDSACAPPPRAPAQGPTGPSGAT